MNHYDHHTMRHSQSTQTWRKNFGLNSNQLLLATIVLIAIIFTMLRAPLLEIPLERDEGEYAYIAQGMHRGELPYSDIFNQKPPGVFLQYRLALSLFGESTESIHFLLHLWNALTSILIFLWLYEMFDRQVAVLATTLYVCLSANASVLSQASNTEILMLLPTVFAAWMAWRAFGKNSLLYFWLVGIGVGLACLFKQVSAVLFIWLIALLAIHQCSSKQKLQYLCMASFGATLPWVPIIAYYIAVGEINELVDSVLLHNLRYATALSIEEGWHRLKNALSMQAVSFGFAWISFFYIFFPTSVYRRERLWITLLAITSFMGVSIGLYYRPHYFIQLLPALCAGAGLGISSWINRYSNHSHRTFARVAALILIVIPPVISNWNLLWADTGQEKSRLLYGCSLFRDSEYIANRIRSVSNIDDTIFILGSEPQILFYANRKSATRYIFLYPLSGNFPDVRKRQLQAMQEIRNSDPKVIVLVNIIGSLFSGESTNFGDSTLLHETYKLIQNKYIIDGVGVETMDTNCTRFHTGPEAASWYVKNSNQAFQSARVIWFLHKENSGH